MQRIQTGHMQKRLAVYLLMFKLLPYHCSAHSNPVQNGISQSCMFSSGVSTH